MPPPFVLGPPPLPQTLAPLRSPVPRRRRRPRVEQPESTDPVSLSSDEMQGRRLRGGAARSAAAGAAAGRPRSQGDDNGTARTQRRKRGDKGGGGREARTWKGRLEEGVRTDQNEERGSKKGSSLSSGKKFEDLDNYLRGCASASAARRKKRKRGFGQSSGGGDSCGGTLTDGGSLSLAGRHEVCESPAKRISAAILHKGRSRRRSRHARRVVSRTRLRFKQAGKIRLTTPQYSHHTT